MERFQNVDDLPSFYIGRSKEAPYLSNRFLLSVSRQLVADTLLRALCPLDARSFLEAAVQDAPMDADAAFALGAFQLRMSLFAENRNPDVVKAAQIHFSKAEKLDSTRSNPFALLGL